MSFFGGDKKGEKTKGLNWLDWSLIVLAVLSVVCGFFLVRWLSGDASGEEGTVVYTVTVSEIDEQLYEDAVLFSVGDHVTSQNGTAILGVIEEIEKRPHRRISVRNGRVVTVEDDGVFDYVVGVRSVGRRQEGDGIRIGDIRIAAGMNLTLRMGDFHAQNGSVTNLQWEEIT